MINRHSVGARAGCQVEHFVREFCHACHRGSQPDAREDVHVIALRRDECAPIDLDLMVIRAIRP